MFRWLFGPRTTPPTTTAPRRDVAALVRPHAVPALHALPVEEDREQDTTRSHFGGAPTLPADVAWPTRAGKPLAFIARLDLPQVQAMLPTAWLPATGALLFFYDMKAMPWGFDPKDRDGWAVLHVHDGQRPTSPLAAAALPYRPLTFRLIDSQPSCERLAERGVELSDEEIDDYFELQAAAFAQQPEHQVGGYPVPVQGDGMELECQLVSHGIYCGTPDGYQDPRARELESSANEWKLLLQVDSDEALGMMWGDAGKLYFWVREPAARVGDFSGCWMVLQCS